MDDEPQAIDVHFRDAVSKLAPHPPGDPFAPLRDRSRLTGEHALELFDAQLGSRHLDLLARELRSRGRGFYTIASAGHEGNAAVAAVLRPTDPALLHYRSGAFYLARAGQVREQQPLRDVILGLVAAADEPIAGGRHKVFGSPALSVIPQTSTVASHLPRALGVAFAIERASRLSVRCVWPGDAVALCSFGDASVNHSSATGAFNAACYATHQHLPLPLLFVCEDNGWGISVPTPSDWIRTAFEDRPHLEYFATDGCDLVATYGAAEAATRFVRDLRRPAFLHLQVVRFMGHAGSDAEIAYRSAQEISADYAGDPLVVTARHLVQAGILTPQEVLDRYESKRDEVTAIAEEALCSRTLRSAPEVMAPLAPRHPAEVARAAAAAPGNTARSQVFGETLPEDEGPLTLASSINRALADLLARHPDLLVFGEDVARKGGVYGVTRGLLKRFGAARVFDTLLDEQSILGLALGLGVSGLLPIPEIQYLAYLHSAEDQVRGEAASLQFFSNDQYRNPMVVRIAGYGYQKGFGGHFHNDNAVGALRDIPGVVIASPARADDAAAMLRTCVAAAAVDGSVCVFLEPIALYHSKDLFAPGDGGWLAPYAPPARWAETHVRIGSARTYGNGRDLTLVTFANGVPMSLRVARRLARSAIGCRVLDLRWLAPLPVDDLLHEAEATGRVLIVDETRRTGGVSEGVLAALVDCGFSGRACRVASEDSFVPLGDAAEQVLVAERTVEQAARKLAT